MTSARWTGVVVVSWLVGEMAAATALAASPALEVTEAARAPTIDGDLLDPCWRKATRIPEFLNPETGKPAEIPTEAWVTCDEQALYAAFRCQVEASKPKAAGKATSSRSAAASLAEKVQFLVCPGTGGAAYYQFSVDSQGARDAVRHWGIPIQADRTWKGNWKAAVQNSAGQWTAEFAIPWRDLATDQAAGAWTMLCARTRGTKSISWPSCEDNVNDPRRFATLTLPQLDSGSRFGLRVLDLDVPHYNLEKTGYSYTVTGLIENQASTARQFVVQAEDVPGEGKPSQAKVGVRAPPKAEVPFQVTMKVDRLGSRELQLRVLDAKTQTVVASSGLQARRFPPLLEAYLDRSYYTREPAARAIFEVHAEVAQALVAECDIRPEGASPIASRAPFEGSPRAVLTLPLKDLPPGKHPAVLRLRDAAGKTLAELATVLRKERPAPSPTREVKVDQERRVALVDGQPFFPIGMYGVPPQYFKEMAGAGFNCTIRWAPGFRVRAGDLKKARDTSAEAGRKLVREYLDGCQQAGLMTLDWTCLWANDRMRYAQADFPKDFLRFVQEDLTWVVEAERSHPALLGYYGPDEPNLAPSRIGDSGTTIVELCQAHHRVVTQCDPYHPSCLFFYGHGKVPVPDWPATYDLTGQSYFYIGRQPPVMSMPQIRTASADLRPRRMPYWHLPLAEWCTTSNRGLTGMEQRIQGYLAVIAGANGIIWWVWPTRYYDNWQELKKMAGEFKALSPILVEVTPRHTIRYEPRQAEDSVQVLVKERAGKTYLITANASEQEAQTTFTLPPEFQGEAKVGFERRTLAVSQGKFSDHFECYGRHVYELPAPWPPGGVVQVAVQLRPGKQLPPPLADAGKKRAGQEPAGQFEFRRDRDCRLARPLGPRVRGYPSWNHPRAGRIVGGRRASGHGGQAEPAYYHAIDRRSSHGVLYHPAAQGGSGSDILGPPQGQSGQYTRAVVVGLGSTGGSGLDQVGEIQCHREASGRGVLDSDPSCTAG